MPTPQLLLDLLSLLVNLGPYAAVVTLVMAGLALRQEGGTNFIIGGGCMKWLLWSAVFITLPQILLWFSNLGIGGGAGGGIGTTYIGLIQHESRRSSRNSSLDALCPSWQQPAR